MYLIPLILGVVFIGIAATSDYDKVELFMLALFMVVIAGFGVHYFFGVNISAVLTDLMEKPSLLMTVTDTSKSGGSGAQVFHVPGQYDYQNAKALCKAYMGKLATFDQVKDGQKRGRNGATTGGPTIKWCSTLRSTRRGSSTRRRASRRAGTRG